MTMLLAFAAYKKKSVAAPEITSTQQ